MAVVDGFYLGCALAQVDLRDPAAVREVLAEYERVRKGPCDDTVEYACMMGGLMHTTNPIKRFLRDALLDHTNFMQKRLTAQYEEPMESQYRLVVDMARQVF